ncbi:MAG: PepSY domain-containing protein [Proteobacteria bacterium]|nr:PepSY domain-containing protein [Pseudomonadota bacterium]
MNPRRTAILLLALCALAAPPALLAAEAPAAEMTMEQAVKRVEQQYHARVVKAEAEKAGERTVYVLRLLDDAGKVWTVHVDAASGAVH